MFKTVFRRLVQSAEVLILGLLILAAVYVSISRILISNVDSFRSEIAGFIEGRLGTPVQIESLEGDWSYLDPGLVVHGLVMGTDKRSVSLHRLSFSLNFLASIMERNPVFNELQIHGLRLTAVQGDDRRWKVQGIPVREGGELNTEMFMDSLPHLDMVRLSDIEINLVGLHMHYKIRSESIDPFELANEDGVKLLSLPLTVEQVDSASRVASVDRVELVGRYRGDPRDGSDFFAELYFQLPSIELVDFLPVLTLNEYSVSRVGVEGKFWYKFSEDEFSLTGVPRVSNVILTSSEKSIALLEDLQSEFELIGTRRESYLYFSRLFTTIAEEEIKLDGTAVTFGDEIVGRIPEIRLSDVGHILMDLGRRIGFLNERALTTLAELNPKGTLRNILLTANPSGERDEMRLVAAVVDGSIEAHLGSPAITALNGLISLGPTGGYIDVLNDETTFTFERMFDEPWYFDRARGRVRLNYDPGFLQVSSGLIELVKDDLKARGKFHLNLPRDRSLQTWGLVVGIQDGPLLDAHRYLPNVMPDAVREWLNRAIKGGSVTEAGLVFHGSLHRDRPKIEKLHELYFTVDDVTLDYAVEWPPVEALSSTVYIGNTQVFTEGARGRVFDTVVSGGRVHVPIDDEEGADMIFVDAGVEGPLNDAIRIFRESPLAEMTNDMARDWTGSGDVGGDIGLKIPIGDRADEEVFAEVSVNLDGNDLTMPRFDMDVMGISGVVRYDNDNGLSSGPLEAEVLNKSVDAEISSVMGEAPGEVMIDVDGSVDLADLQAWSGQVILTRASGVMNYQAEIHVPYGARSGENSYVLARSNLEGVTIDLPVPMRKEASVQKPLVYKQVFLEESGYRVELSLGEKVNGVLKIADGVVQGGHVRYGKGKPGAVAFDKVRVTGRIETVDYDRWEEVAEYLEDHSEISLSSELAGRLDAIEVDIGTLDAFGIALNEVRSTITRKEGRWNVALDSELLSGVVKIAIGDDDQPIDVDLDYVRLPAGDADGETVEDPLGDIEPGELVAVDFKTREFVIGEENYGAWSFQLRHDENGSVFQNLEAEVKGLSVVSPSEVVWRGNGDKIESRFNGNVVTGDLANALRQWGFASSIEGEDFHFVADLRWPGSPAMISLDSIKGRVALEDGKGRFVQAERAGPLKMLGIFDFASLARRFRFDFSDIVDKGFEFEEIDGVTQFSGGVLNIVEPIEIEGTSSIIKVGGTINLNTRELDNEMIVTLPVNRNLPWYAAYSAIATGPLMGAGVILAQKIFENQIDQFSSAKYKVTGTLDQPKIAFVSIFTDDMKEIKLQEDEP